MTYYRWQIILLSSYGAPPVVFGEATTGDLVAPPNLIQEDSNPATLGDFETKITGFTNSVSHVSTNKCKSVNGTPLDYFIGDALGKQ